MGFKIIKSEKEREKAMLNDYPLWHIKLVYLLFSGNLVFFLKKIIEV